MKEIDFNQIKEYWKKNKYPINIYIHSPYCKSMCDYCMYKGNLPDGDFDRYFNEVLPESINRYKEIISANKVQGIYFGGGTPNFRSDLSNLIPAFKATKDIMCGEKTIELHMGMEITDETIKVLERYGFNTVILCQQTFDQEILKKHNRITTDKNDINEIVSKMHKARINCGFDLLYFEDEPIDTLLKDLETAVNAGLDEITVAPIYSDRDQTSFFRFKKVYDLFRYTDYVPDADYSNENWRTLKTFRWFKRPLWSGDYVRQPLFNFYSFVAGLEDSIPDMPFYSSTLGIGSFNNKIKKTYSNINRQYFYCEDFDGKETHYYLLRDKSFYDIMREVIDWAEKSSDEPVPSGTVFSFKNTDLSNFERDFDKATYFFSIDVPVDTKPPYIADLNMNKVNLLQNPIS